MKLIPISAVIAAIALAGCSAASSSSSSAPAAAPSSHTAKPHKIAGTKAKTKGKSENAAADACYARKGASGDIIVRFKTPGQAWIAQELGGGYLWNVTSKKCLTSVQMQMAAAPMIAGACTQVGYVKDNPGYDVNADSAPPLKKVIESAGPGC
jgi:hypothetical protein